MSATKLRLAIASRGSRRGSRSPLTKPPAARTVSHPDPAPQPRPQELERTPEPCAAPALVAQAAPESWWETDRNAEQARAVRLSPMWQMTPSQRVDAMRRGRLTYEQLAAWSARNPEQVPLLNGEFEWLAALMPEVCE